MAYRYLGLVREQLRQLLPSARESCLRLRRRLLKHLERIPVRLERHHQGTRIRLAIHELQVQQVRAVLRHQPCRLCSRRPRCRERQPGEPAIRALGFVASGHQRPTQREWLRQLGLRR